METKNIRNCLSFLSHNCIPPFPESEIEAKIQSALNRAKDHNLNLAQEVEYLVSSSTGTISSSYIAQCLQLSSRNDRKNISKILSRLMERKLIERTGKRAGEYRIVNSECRILDWYNADYCPVKLYLPLELTDKVLITPGDMVLVAGSMNSGKSAFLMNAAKENYQEHKVHYFTSEMSANKFRRRLSLFPDVNLEDFQRYVTLYERHSDFHDVIIPGEGNLNIIDYLEVYDEFWKIAKSLAQIFEKLQGALCVVAIQKAPGSEYGRGGSFTQEKPVLSISLDRGTATITKCKEFPDEIENPQGKKFDFKLVQGCRFLRRYMDFGWHRKDKDGI